MHTKDFTTFKAQLAKEFNSLNRNLIVADQAESWQPAVTKMAAFLEEVKLLLESEPSLVGEDLSLSSRIFSLLLSLAATGTQGRLELYKGKDEKSLAYQAEIENDYLPLTNNLRLKAIEIAKAYLSNPVFKSLHEDIKHEIHPLLDSLNVKIDPDRFMPYRVIQIGNIADRLYAMRLRTADPILLGLAGKKGLLREIYDRKYLRFGTSGVRGRWGNDFTETRARQVVQAVCDFLNNNNIPSYVGAEDLSGKIIVLGHDTRRNSDVVTRWAAETCLANGFRVHIGNRDIPTPALAFYETEVLAENEVAGLLIATASHNPPEWQGIKFNPRLGYPAPTNVTDFIAHRINELQLADEAGGQSDVEEARSRGLVQGFDPLDAYVKWIQNNANGNARIPIDFDRIRRYFADKMIVIDEMHGAGRGYLSRLVGEAGLRYTIVHAEVDPDLGGQDYANPEEPFNWLLKKTVAETGAQVGFGMDTDADRFGIIDKGGVYFRPNQILPMLIRYLGVDRGLTGRVIATQTGSPLIEVLAGMIPANDENKPAEGALPAYIGQKIYKAQYGDIKSRALKNAFAVPVGIKYIEEIRRTDAAYNSLKVLPNDWRDRILIGGEESSGLTTRGHITDKDGPWANLLILDMLAYYGTREEKPLNSLQEIWDELVHLPGLWESFGTSTDPTSHAGRADVDAPLEAKEAFISHFLDLPAYTEIFEPEIDLFKVEYLGGIRYELVETQLSDDDGNDRYYLRMRASGTEPINRVYIEAANLEAGQRIMAYVLEKLEFITCEVLSDAHSPWHLVDMLAQSQLTDATLRAVRETILYNEWDVNDIISKIQQMAQTLEKRNRKVIGAWEEALK
jgi:phosphomannomutase